MQSSASLPLLVSRHRFAFVDGLRGLAALGVAVLHILPQPLGEVSRMAGKIAGRCGMGVDVFFVISGFVISHTLARTHMTAGTAARFLVKRMARLHPPYWASIVLVLAVATAASVGLHHPFIWPRPKVVAAHLFYLQYLLGMPSFADTYWTLCLEIQFTSCWSSSSTSGSGSNATPLRPWRSLRYSDRFFSTPSWSHPVSSMLRRAPVSRTGMGVAGGIAAQRLIAGRGWSAIGVAVLTALAISLITGTVVGLVVAIAVLAIGSSYALGQLDSWLASRPLQYLGKISYSVYLVHPTVGARAANLLNHGLSAGPGMRVATGVSGIGISIVVAHFFWRVVERPSLDLSRWLASRLPEPPPRLGGLGSFGEPSPARVEFK